MKTNESEPCSMDCYRLALKLQSAIRKIDFVLAKQLVTDLVILQRTIELAAFGLDYAVAAQAVDELLPDLEEEAA